MSTLTPSRPTRAAALVLLALASVALSGCSIINGVFGGGQATRDESGEVIEGNDATDVFTLLVGDCGNSPDDSEVVSTIPTVPCDEPHDFEIYFSHIMSDVDYPGQDAIAAEGDEVCLGAFPDFIGIPYADSQYYYSYYFPTEGSWAEGDREILCFAYDQAGQITGSLENIGQ